MPVARETARQGEILNHLFAVRKGEIGFIPLGGTPIGRDGAIRIIFINIPVAPDVGRKAFVADSH